MIATIAEWDRNNKRVTIAIVYKESITAIPLHHHIFTLRTPPLVALRRGSCTIQLVFRFELFL